MAEPEATPTVPVELLYSPAPREVWQWAGMVPSGSTVAEVIDAAGFRSAHPAVVLDDGPRGNVGIWGRRCALSTPVRANDRVEVWRPLVVDPKQARRERYARHQSRVQQTKPRLLRPTGGR